MRNRDAEKIKGLEQEKEALELQVKAMDKLKEQAAKDKEKLHGLERALAEGKQASSQLQHEVKELRVQNDELFKKNQALVEEKFAGGQKFQRKETIVPVKKLD